MFLLKNEECDRKEFYKMKRENKGFLSGKKEFYKMKQENKGFLSGKKVLSKGKSLSNKKISHNPDKNLNKNFSWGFSQRAPQNFHTHLINPGLLRDLDAID